MTAPSPLTSDGAPALVSRRGEGTRRGHDPAGGRAGDRPPGNEVTGRQLLAWADLDERRRRGRWGAGAIVALVAGLGLGLEAARRGGWFDGERAAAGTAFLVAVVLGAFVPTMLAAPHRMFWRADAAMIARLPIAGAALWHVAVVRAARGAAIGLVIAAPTIAVTAVAAPGVGLRLGLVAAALALAAVALVPAVCLGAAHLVASGQAAAAARTLAGEYTVGTTTWLGALPGFAIANVVLGVVAAGTWISRGEAGAGPGAVIAIAAVALAAAAAATLAAPRIYPRAMREVAALDRQILAHLELDPATGLERAVRDRLGPGAARVFDRLVRLARRRYPLFALLGALGALAMIGVAIGRPDDGDVWLAILAAILAATGASLHRATGTAPLELARSTATLPIAAADLVVARRAATGLWLAVWTVVPPAVALARSARPLVTAAALAIGALAGVALALGRRTSG